MANRKPPIRLQVSSGVTSHRHRQLILPATWLVLFQVALLVAIALTVGCHKRSTSSTSEDGDSPTPASVDHFADAGRMFELGDFDAAAAAAYKALLQDPESLEAILIASEVEAARGNHQVAAELAASIDAGSRLGQKATEIHAQQLIELNRISDAADVIQSALEVTPNANPWRHLAWELLTRVGRREEASRQAETLCRAGQANQRELLSLVRRTESFPTMLDDDQDPKSYFEPGLAMARWHFTQQEFRQAIDELTNEYQSGFETIAAAALYGRLLAESQAFEDIPAWLAKCDPKVSELGDYWAALGTYFFDQRHYQASAKALLEAVVRNPTDRVCFQRLAKVFDALGRAEDAAEFRARGIQLANAERSSEALMRSGSDLGARQNLTRSVMELGRPFETLQWTLSMLPSGAAPQRAAVSQQRADLLRSDRALVMASESSLIGIDPTDFSLQPAYEDLLRAAASSSKPKSKSIDVPPLASPRLVNVAHEVGLDFQWYQDEEINIASIPIHESVGGGIAVIDYDLDGWQDVYLAQGSGEPPSDACARSSLLFRNVDASFIEVTSLAGAEDFNYSSGLAAGDVNQDGLPDLFLGSLGHNRLLINNGDGTFRDATEKLGPVADRFTSSLAIADINGDQLPDLFESIYIEMEGAFRLPEVGPDGREVQPSPLLHYAQSDRWFQNMGDGSFALREISRDVAKPGTSLGLVVTDFDADGANEVFVGNDVRPNHFLVQAGGNQFQNAADAKGVANGFSGAANGCMGIAPGDFNRDGLLDLHITNFSEESANLYIQSSGGGFTDLAIRYGIDQFSVPNVGFGTKAIDVDRNGWLDLIVTNGHIFDMRYVGEEFQMPPQLLMGRGSRFELASVEDESGYWQRTYLGRSIATIDFDRDGAIDFLVGHLDQPLALLHNQTDTEGRWVQFELVGAKSERDAIGARVVLTTGEHQFTQWVTAGDGYFCSDQPIVDFGIGTDQEVDQVEVFWPSGGQQTIRRPQPGHRYLVLEGDPGVFPRRIGSRR